MSFIIPLLFLVLLITSDVITNNDTTKSIKKNQEIMLRDTADKMFPSRRIISKLDEFSDILKDYLRLTDDIVLQMAITKAVLFETIDGVEYGVYAVSILDKAYLTVKYAENPFGNTKPEHIQRMRSENWTVLMNMQDSSLALSIPSETIVGKIKNLSR